MNAKQKKPTSDIVDVLVTAETSSVHSMLQYPLLDGTQSYTVAVTEFCCPLSQQSPLPTNLFFSDDVGMFFRLRRKNVGAAPNTNGTLMPGDMAGPLGGPGGGANSTCHNVSQKFRQADANRG